MRLWLVVAVVPLVVLGGLAACTVMNGLSVPVPSDAASDESRATSSSTSSSSSSSSSSSGSTGTSGEINKDASSSSSSSSGLAGCATKGGTCLSPTKGCKQFTDTLRCDVVGESCCVVACPTLPAATCAPGSRVVTTFDPSTRCRGSGCSPTGCADAGGACGANGQCPAGTFIGNATDYPCSDSSSGACCLPGDP